MTTETTYLSRDEIETAIASMIEEKPATVRPHGESARGAWTANGAGTVHPQLSMHSLDAMWRAATMPGTIIDENLPKTLSQWRDTLPHATIYREGLMYHGENESAAVALAEAIVSAIMQKPVKWSGK